MNWQKIAECRDWNGEITGYSVRYGEEGISKRDRSIKKVKGEVATISELTKETVYTVAVAAETSAGTGVYSEPRTIQTPNGEI